MKIAFVNDCVERLGVEYLSAVLKENGHQVKLFVDPQLFNNVYLRFRWLDRQFDFTEAIIKDLTEYQPDLIGFSVDTESYQWASRLARSIKARLKTPIIFGGIHPTSVPERVILNQGVDIVCIGEGEYPMLALVESLQKGQMDTSINNLWFKHNGTIVKNAPGPLIADLDTLPIADQALFYEHSPYFRKGYGTVVSRGCPYACAYCAHSYLRQLYKTKGRYLRQRSVRHVMEELRMRQAQRPIDVITFFDDNFGFDHQWLAEFSTQYANVIGKRFTVTAHPEIISPEYIRLLKKAGCCSVTLGIQTWDTAVLKDWFNRTVNPSVMLQAMRLVKEAGLELICDNIFGAPGQDDEQYVQSLLPFTDVKPDRILFNQLKYFPHVPITEKARTERFISSERYHFIMEGQDQEGVYLGTEEGRPTSNRKGFIKMKGFLFLMDSLPATWSRAVIKKKLYRYFPSFINPSFIMASRTLFSSDTDTKFFKRRMLSRYRYHLIQWVKARFKTLWPRRNYAHSN